MAHVVAGQKHVRPCLLSLSRASRLGKAVQELLGQPVHAAKVFLRVIDGIGLGGHVIRKVGRFGGGAGGGAVAEYLRPFATRKSKNTGSGEHLVGKGQFSQLELGLSDSAIRYDD